MHIKVMQWITCTIILHNLIIDAEGEVSGAYFQPFHSATEEEQDAGSMNNMEGEEDNDNMGEIKCQLLMAELLAHRQRLGIPF